MFSSTYHLRSWVDSNEKATIVHLNLVFILLCSLLSSFCCCNCFQSGKTYLCCFWCMCPNSKMLCSVYAFILKYIYMYNVIECDEQGICFHSTLSYPPHKRKTVWTLEKENKWKKTYWLLLVCHVQWNMKKIKIAALVYNTIYKMLYIWPSFGSHHGQFIWKVSSWFY